jgi:hypothetical protein
MGSAQSRNVTDTTIIALSDVTTKIISAVELNTDQRQIIHIRDVQNLNLSGITQRIRATVDMQALMDAMSTSTSQQEIISEMTQASNSLISGINLLNFSNATNELKSYLEATLTITTTIEQQCSAFAQTSQEIIIEQVSGRANISNITQESMANLMSDCMQNAVAESEATQSLQQTIDQSASAETKGLDLMGILIAVAIVIAALALMFAVGGKTAGNLVSVIVFGISGAAGLLFFILFILSIEEIMEVTIFSTLLKNSPECNWEILDEVTTINDPVFAGNQCLQNEDCVAFDWNSVRVLNTGQPQIIMPPITTYYSSLSQNPCRTVQDDRDNQRIIYSPALHRSTEDPPSTDLPDVYDRDVWLNTKTLDFWIFTPGIPWATSTEDNHLLKEPLTDDYDQNSTINWQARTPTNDDAENGDIWVDSSNPTLLQVYVYGSSEWSLNNEDLRSGGYSTDLGCRHASLPPTDPDDPEFATNQSSRHIKGNVNEWFQRTGAFYTGEDPDPIPDPSPAPLPEICANVTGFQTTAFNGIFAVVGILGLLLCVMGVSTSTSKDKKAGKDAKGGSGGIPIVGDILP